MADDADGKWMEVGFQSMEELIGTAETGWTDPRGYCLLDLQSSVDLATWETGEFEDCATTAIDNGDGTWSYWSRGIVPANWEEVMVDLTLTTDRYGKSITSISVMGSSVSLPHFPYAMSADAATLQTDLRAAGYTGATVTVTSGAITATARNHTVDGTANLPITHSGSNVTAVTFGGSTISLPDYPYAMPSQRADLQADLRTAGYSGTVVKLHGDTWEIMLPDRTASGLMRAFSLAITPDDPFMAWDRFGAYLGELPDTYISGGSGNVRDPDGNPLEERVKQFARLRIRQGPRALP